MEIRTILTLINVTTILLLSILTFFLIKRNEQKIFNLLFYLAYFVIFFFYSFEKDTAYRLVALPFVINVLLPLFYLNIRILSFQFRADVRIFYHFLPAIALITVFVLLSTWIDIELLYKNALLISIVLYYLQLLFYAFIIFREIRRYDNFIKKISSNVEQISLSWAKILIYIQAILIVTDGLAIISYQYGFISQNFLHIIDHVIYCFFFCLFFIFNIKHAWNVSMVFEQQSKYELATLREEMEKMDAVKSLAIHYDEKKQIELAALFERNIIETKLFLDPNINLLKVSKLLGTNTSYLSYVINKFYSSSFNELINHHRLEHARNLLKEVSGKYTIEHIATLAGFNSKSTFYRLFKSKYGITPKECMRK
ncbi:MAG: helix-turn-helix domain-containing protein [Bacteroidales bacterium]|nr:helix-turn-helix domain-containing protein [Bacteroidales bacterium]